MLRLPAFLGLPINLGGEMKWRRRRWFFPQFFPKFFRKSIDGVEFKVLAGTLSPWERLFEIYFVRLIGTPNQNSKKSADFDRHSV